LELLYFIITLLATTAGAISGFGGGIIIKPALDAMRTYDALTIGAISSITVLSMATVSTAKYIKSGMKMDIKIIILSIGAVIGGVLGKFTFELFAGAVSDGIAKVVQASILALLLIFVFFRKYYPHFKVENKILIASAGLFMGAISSFLGIGGGPINIVIICIIFSSCVKDAAVYSIFVIFFSQLASVISTAISPGLGAYDLKVLLFMIPAAVIGGFAGAHLNRKFSKHFSEIVFNTLMVSILALNVYNIVVYLL